MIAATHAADEAVPAGRVVEQLRPVERRTQHRRVSHLAADPAADTTVVDVRDRIGAQRVGVVLHRQRRAAGQADTGVIAGARIRVDAEALAHHALAACIALRISGRTRRWRFSWHSPSATITFGPR